MQLNNVVHFLGIRPTADESKMLANQLRHQEALLSRRAELCPPDDVADNSSVTPATPSSSLMPASINKSMVQQQHKPSDFRKSQPLNDNFSTSMPSTSSAAADNQAAATETMMDESSRRQRRRNKFYGTDEETDDSRTREQNVTSARRRTGNEVQQQLPVAVATPAMSATIGDRRQQQSQCETADVAIGRHQFAVAGEKVAPAAAAARDGRWMRVHEGGADSSLAATTAGFVTATVVNRTDAPIGSSVPSTAAPMSPTSGRRVTRSAKSADHRVPSSVSATAEMTPSVRRETIRFVDRLKCNSFHFLASNCHSVSHANI
jgi:hypothetical protein